MPDTPSSLLSRVFGYSEFRGDQAAIVDTLVAGNDALVLMPTGGGKSLCFQIPGAVARRLRSGGVAADRTDAGSGRRP